MPLTDRKKGEKLTTDEIETLVGGMIDAAQSFVEEVLSPERETATDYYHGRPFGNEEEGRSRVVSTDVRDTVQAMLPSLMRVFYGPERVVEYRPRNKEDIEGAEQATDYVNLVILEDNNGFVMMWGVFKDALVRKTGFVKWWWEPHKEIAESQYTGLTEEEYETLLVDPEVEIEDLTLQVVELDGQLLNTYSLTVRRTTEDGRIRVEAIPPEEVLWNRNARTLEDALIVVHSREVKVSDLVALGFDSDELEPLAGSSRVQSSEDTARRFDRGATIEEEEQDPATRPIRYNEAYALLDREGDGHVQLTKICMGGDAHEILHLDGKPAIEGIDHLPIALFCPDPEPHTLVGQSMADYTMDLQKIQSSILRGTLDSMNLAINPRMAFVEGRVNLKDLLNTEIGTLIRCTAPPDQVFREISHRFVGGDTLPMMDRIDDIRATRTGMSKASQGLDPKILQSTEKAAVGATLSKAQERLEIIARIFAETGMKQLFKGLLKTLIAHQDIPRIVRLRNKYVQVDPRTWDAKMDVVVNVGLGSGTTDEKLAVLQEIATRQEAALEKLGPMGNPLVSLTKYRNTLGRMTELAGFKNSDEFWNPITEEQEQQMAQQAQEAQAQQPQGDPATLALVEVEKEKAQVQVQKNQADFMFKQEELEFKKQEAALEDDRERDKQAAEYAIRLKELEMKYGAEVDRTKLEAETQDRRMQLDADTKVRLSEKRVRLSRDEDGGLMVERS